MAYRKPAVTVIQEFIGLIPALAAFALPSVAVGPVFQLVNSDLLGTYSGNSQDYPYASKIAGSQVDLEELSPTELFVATKKPIALKIVNAEVEVKAASLVGVGALSAFSDVTAARFTGVASGDSILITPVTGIAILAPQTNGVSTDTIGQHNRLASGVPGEFADVKVGDTVTVTGGVNTVTGPFIVNIKVNDDLLVLDADINTGAGASTNVAFSISGDRGALNAGAYKIKTVTDANNIILESTLVEPESFISYIVKRKVASIDVARADYTADADKISLAANYAYLTFPVIAGEVKADYRALRNDMANNVKQFARLSELQAFFGLDQINPANPLAYGLSVMLQNTTTPVNGLGLNGEAVSNETSSFQNSFDVLSLTDMYAITPLTQNPAIHQQLKAHVEGLSQPAKKKERVGIVNRLIKKEETIKDPSTTVITSNGSRIIVNTQVDGSALFASPTILNDGTVDAFLNVRVGDTVDVVGGTGAILGEKTVLSKQSSNQITLSGNIVSGSSTDLQYFIIRKDGISADGVTFYDRSATFITDGVAPGYKFRISAGTFKGDYVIATIISEKSFTVAQIPGITSLQTAVAYEIIRDLSKTEQAAFIKGYSASIGSRRIVNIWPDIVYAPVGPVSKALPGFYAGCAIAAMTTGLPTQQGFTNLSMVGFLGFEHSTGYFSDDQMDDMADGGTMILAQEGDQSPLFVRHQLSTDRSSIKFQEFSVTKNVDYIAKFIRSSFKNYIGVYNIVETTLDELRANAKAVLTFLKDSTRLPRIGGVIRNGQLSKLEESQTQIDTIIMRFKLSIPIPLNNLDITIEV